LAPTEIRTLSAGTLTAILYYTMIPNTVLIYSTRTSNGKIHAESCPIVKQAERSSKRIFRAFIVIREYIDDTVADLRERGDKVSTCKCVTGKQ
jgi:hypothetical protein